MEVSAGFHAAIPCFSALSDAASPVLGSIVVVAFFCVPLVMPDVDHCVVSRSRHWRRWCVRYLACRSLQTCFRYVSIDPHAEGCGCSQWDNGTGVSRVRGNRRWYSQRHYRHCRAAALTLQCAYRQHHARQTLLHLRREARFQYRKPLVLTPAMRLAALEKHAARWAKWVEVNNKVLHRCTPPPVLYLFESNDDDDAPPTVCPGRFLVIRSNRLMMAAVLLPGLAAAVRLSISRRIAALSASSTPMPAVRRPSLVAGAGAGAGAAAGSTAAAACGMLFAVSTVHGHLHIVGAHRTVPPRRVFVVASASLQVRVLSRWFIGESKVGAGIPVPLVDVCTPIFGGCRMQCV